jgi:hypothetical protein
MKREDLRKFAIETADSIIDGFSNNVRRAAALFETPEKALAEFIMPEINAALGLTMYPTAVYTGEIRDIGLMLTPKDQPWTQSITQVSAIAKQGNAEKVFKPGDYLYIPISVPETKIDGVEFPAINDGGAKLVITHVFENLVIFNFENVIFHAPVNSRNTSDGGLPKSTLGKYLNGHFMKSIFASVEDCLTPNGDGLKVSLPTRCEVFGGEDKTVNWGKEGVRHSYFVKCTNRIKVNNDDVDDTNWWWLSTAAYSTSFCGVYDYGYASYNIANDTNGGVAPAICVS